MSTLESAQAVGAQQQYIGSKGMRALGFPKAFFKAQAATRSDAETELADAGRALGWPGDVRGVPSAGWLASETGLQALYQFLYAATSKGVHFAPSEALRSAWSRSPEPTAEVTVMAQTYQTYRTDFSLHWLCLLLLDTAIALWPAVPHENQLADDVAAQLLQAAENIGSVGRLPIVLASEFNLTQAP
jgi:hypothetical protein